MIGIVVEINQIKIEIVFEIEIMIVLEIVTKNVIKI